MHITAFGDSSMGGTGISEWFSRLKLKEVANWRQMLVKYHFADYWQQGRRERIRAPVKKKKKFGSPSTGEPTKDLHTKSARPTVSCRVT